MLTRSQLYDADGVGSVDPVALRAGPLTMEFEPETGFLRYVRLGDRELIRAVYAAVRDHEWRTVRASIHDVEVTRRSGSFELTFGVRAVEEPVDFRWTGRVAGEEDGSVRFEMEGRAAARFRRNRIGLCVLHPPWLAGSPCRLETIEGERVEARFPERIASAPIFRDLAGLEHRTEGHRTEGHRTEGRRTPDEEGRSAEPGNEEIWTALRFEGDVFETEDQRNWTDGSFKTYCTPVARPAPVTVEKGDRVEQAVEITLVGVPNSSAAAGEEAHPGGDGTPRSIRRGPSRPRPWIGVAVEDEEGDRERGTAARSVPDLGVELVDPSRVSGRNRWRLERLRLDHVRYEIRPGRSGWRDRLERTAELARSVDLELELAVFIDRAPEEELTAVADALAETDSPLARVLLYEEGAEIVGDRHLDLARDAFEDVLGDADLLGATNCYFTELNAHRPEVERIDGVSYSINPQVHAFDNRSMVETLDAQPETVRTARTFVGDRSVVVSPVTLRPRFNPDALEPGAGPGAYPGERIPADADDRDVSSGESGSTTETAASEPPENADPRQATLFAAAWTLGSLAALADGGCDSITWFEATGERGLMGRPSGAPSADAFPSVGRGVYPVYHVLADVAEFRGGSVLRARSERPLAVRALSLDREGERRLLLANVTDRPQVVEAELPGRPSRVLIRPLDETTVPEAIHEPDTFRKRRGRELETDAGTVRLSLLPYGVTRVDSV